MAVDNVHTLYNVGFGATPDMVAGITRVNLRLASNFRKEIADGQVYVRQVNIVDQNCDGDFASRAIATMLDTVGLTGLSLATSALTFFAQKAAIGATRAGATSHRKYAAATGIVVPRRLSVGYDEDATIEYGFALYSADGSAAPYTITDSQSLPAATADNERFRLGPVTIAGTTLTSVRRVDIEFGVELAVIRADGDVWPTWVHIKTIMPVITIRGIDPKWLANTAAIAAGIEATQANTDIWLRKWDAAGAGYVAEATAEHIHIETAAMGSIEDIFSAAVTDDAGETSLVLHAYHDGSLVPLVIDTSAAISA